MYASTSGSNNNEKLAKKRQLIKICLEQAAKGMVEMTDEILSADDIFFDALRIEADYQRSVGNFEAAYWLDYSFAPEITSSQHTHNSLFSGSKHEVVESHTDRALLALMYAESKNDVKNAINKYPFMTEDAFHKWVRDFVATGTLRKDPTKQLKWLVQISKENSGNKSGFLSKLFGFK